MLWFPFLLSTHHPDAGCEMWSADRWAAMRKSQFLSEYETNRSFNFKKGLSNIK